MDALRLHVQRGQLAHFSRADDQHGAAFEIAENLFRERHGGKAHRHGARAEAGFRPDALADRERGMKEPVEEGADDVRRAGD